MKEFEFASAGIMVVFRGEDLFLSEKLLAEFEDRYVGRVSERTLARMLTVAQNVEAIRNRAEELGKFATFGTITSWLSSEALATEGNRRDFVREMGLYRRKLVKLTGASMVWVSEHGRVGGRLHGHFVADRAMRLEAMEEAKVLCRYPLDVEINGEMFRARMEARGMVGRTQIKGLGAPGYMHKEMGKSVGRTGLGFKLMGTLGEFAGQCGVRDFVLDSPMAECRRLAWRERRRGEPHRVTWERGREMFREWLRGEQSLGRKYDRFRERCGGRDWRDADFKLVADAWEDGGDTDFDVANFENVTGAEEDSAHECGSTVALSDAPYEGSDAR